MSEIERRQFFNIIPPKIINVVNKLMWICLLIIVFSSIPFISGKEIDSSKRIGANSTVGVIGFSPGLSFSFIKNNETTGMTKISDADVGSGYTWVNIGFVNVDDNNTMIIKALMENRINYTSTVISGTQIIWVPTKNTPTVVIGGIFAWNNTTKIITIINSAFDVIITWLIVNPVTIALPIFIFGLIALMLICLRFAIKKR